MSGNVKVCCRFRPQLPNEFKKGGTSIVVTEPSGTSCTINGTRKMPFTFDRIFNDASTQEEVYDFAAKPIVEDVLKGYNGTIFAYGQTSSGKTFTMEGPNVDGPERGIIPRIVQNVFYYIDLAPEALEFTVRVSYFEIYMERIRDLLCEGNDDLQIHENRDRGVYVRHATELYMRDPEDVMDVMRAGAERRSVASTMMNDISSRSHSVFLMEITQKDTVKGGSKTGKLFLVDLAGSEKVSKTGAEGAVLDEAKTINKSLAALGLVIMSLTEGSNRRHVPYRDSKLTRILQESLGGNAQTTIIICCSPSSYNEQETFSTLRFGQRAKKIKNKARINVQYSAEELEKQLGSARQEIVRLANRLAKAEAELEIWRNGGTVSEADRLKPLAAAAVASAVGASGAGEPQDQGLSEEERQNFETQIEELKQRETELLDLLDDKDEHVRDLEREIESHGNQEVEITRLASENGNLRDMLKEVEAREEELLAESEEYEIAIEEMAEANRQLETQITDLEMNGADTTSALQAVRKETQELLTRVSNVVTSLVEDPESTGETGVALLDAQIARAKEASLEKAAETARLQQACDEVTASKKKLQVELQELSKNLAEAQTALGQATNKLGDATQSRDRLAKDLEEMKAKYDESQTQCTLLMAKSIETQESKEAEQQRSALEEQFEKQLSESKQLNQEMKDQIGTLQEEVAALQSKLDEKEIEQRNLQSDYEIKSNALAETEAQLEQVTSSTTQQQEIQKKTRSVEQAVRRQLQGCTAFKVKKQEDIRSMMAEQKSVLRGISSLLNGESAAAVSNATSDPRTKALQDMLERQQKQYRTQSDKVKTMQQELVTYKKLSQQRKQAIAALETKNQKMQEQLDGKMRQAPIRAGRAPRPVEKKPIIVNVKGNAGRSSSGSLSNSDASKFWKGDRSHSTIRNQGESHLGQYAHQQTPEEKKMEEELTTPEYV